MKLRRSLSILMACLAMVIAPNGSALAGTCSDPITNPAEVQVGDRLFRETRFSEFFFNFLESNPKNTVNTPLKPGDPTVNVEQNAAGKPIRDPFRGLSMNCRNCHLGNDLLGTSHLDGRTYCDFASRSPIPSRSDGRTTTPRNAPELVSVTIPREVPFLFHFDGEFASISDLALGTMTGRNFGWLPTEFQTAENHIINVLQNDDGKNALARRYGCGGFPYSVVLAGTDPRLPARLVLPEQYRIDVMTATPDAIMADVGAIIQAYMDSITFNVGEPPSPYDVFLTKNNLPIAPNSGETDAAYAQRLLGLINGLSNPIFVTPKDGKFKLHKQTFQFGPNELQGLKIFFTQPSGQVASGAGNCVACHTPPAFTDNIFHNTGVAQLEYDAIFGPGQFASIVSSLPDLSTRNANFNEYLPPSPNHPNATGQYRAPASSASSGFTDLGAWNIVGNPDIPNPQSALSQILCAEFNLSSSNCTAANILPMAPAFFKTPSVRDLGQSNPYLHNGSLNAIPDVLSFYVEVSEMARSGNITNASPELSNVFLGPDDIAPLNAFLNSLNEDYH